MLPKIINLNFIVPLFLAVYSFFINWFSGNIGVLPIDTFGFFDTGFSILKNKLPIRDFWIFTGLIVDYFQAIFFLLFGPSWKSYIFHASIINIFGTLSFYYFLKSFKLNHFAIIIYCLSFATLCYPVSGTPFAYLHSYIFSLISIFLFIYATRRKKNLSWFILPFIFFISFFSMQTPSIYIIILILFFSLFFFIKNKKNKNLQFFLLGSLSSLLIFIIFLLLTKTPLEKLIYQYFLFPLTIGEGRWISDVTAYTKLSDQINFKRLIGDFKFIHIFYFPLFLLTINLFFKKNKQLFFVNLIILTSCFLFFFNQLMQANQIYIFSLIPLLASILHINIKDKKINKNFLILIFCVLVFSTVKYHFRYNLDRKFLDIENKNKQTSVEASNIDIKLKHLKWITPFYENPLEEVDLIKVALTAIKSDSREKMLITHYQFFSLLLDKDLNILNRWYLWDNNTHPTENHKYFEVYRKMAGENLKKNNIEVIYLLGSDKEILFSNIKNYFDNVCFKNNIIVKNKFSYHEIIDCKN
jgi:hypothetical protein